MSVNISLAEPVLFLQGHDQNNQAGSPALLRGSLVMRLSKPAKIKAITLTFKGRARTEWPEGEILFISFLRPHFYFILFYLLSTIY